MLSVYILIESDIKGQKYIRYPKISAGAGLNLLLFGFDFITKHREEQIDVYHTKADHTGNDVNTMQECSILHCSHTISDVVQTQPN